MSIKSISNQIEKLKRYIPRENTYHWETLNELDQQVINEVATKVNEIEEILFNRRVQKRSNFALMKVWLNNNLERISTFLNENVKISGTEKEIQFHLCFSDLTEARPLNQVSNHIYKMIESNTYKTNSPRIRTDIETFYNRTSALILKVDNISIRIGIDFNSFKITLSMPRALAQKDELKEEYMPEILREVELVCRHLTSGI